MAVRVKGLAADCGAAAGLNRSEADVRVLQHRGAGLISKATARSQLEYIEDASSEQDEIDREELANIFFQRFAGDQNTKMSTLAKAVREMATGKSLIDVIEIIAPELLADEQARQAAQDQAAAGPPAEAGTPPEQNQEALAAGGQQPSDFQPKFAPPPLSQIITRNPVF